METVSNNKYRNSITKQYYVCVHTNLYIEFHFLKHTLACSNVLLPIVQSCINICTKVFKGFSQRIVRVRNMSKKMCNIRGDTSVRKIEFDKFYLLFALNCFVYMYFMGGLSWQLLFTHKRSFFCYYVQLHRYDSLCENPNHKYKLNNEQLLFFSSPFDFQQKNKKKGQSLRVICKKKD